MTNIIDRREVHKHKVAPNKTRFIDKIKYSIRRRFNDIVPNSNGNVDFPVNKQDLHEPRFKYGNGGIKEQVWAGNKELRKGDRIRKPPQQEGTGSKASNSGEGEDDFIYQLTVSELQDILFKDLALPDLQTTTLKKSEVSHRSKGGYAAEGPSSNLSLVKTFNNALSRRFALSHTQELKELEAIEDKDEETIKRIEELKNKRIPFIDKMDLRYHTYIEHHKSVERVLMICIMDVSGSMGRLHKEKAKTLFELLYGFLQYKYKMNVDVEFIRHHTSAKVCDHDEFFFSRETGGTIISTSYEAAIDLIKTKYSANTNIYVMQASDGDNWGNDNVTSLSLLRNELLPMIQHFYYIQILQTQGYLGTLYENLNGNSKLTMKFLDAEAQVYLFFRRLFANEN